MVILVSFFTSMSSAKISVTSGHGPRSSLWFCLIFPFSIPWDLQVAYRDIDYERYTLDRPSGTKD